LWRDIKQRVHELADSKQATPIWIIDAQNLPAEFFRDFPAFLNRHAQMKCSRRRSKRRSRSSMSMSMSASSITLSSGDDRAISFAERGLM